MATTVASAFLGGLLLVGPPAAQAATGAQPSRYASIVVDADTGAVLYERNADLPRHPASLTKVMTLYLAFEALAAKKLKLTDELPVSGYAAGRDPSRLNLAPGSRLKVEDAIRAMATKSANDASVVIAEALAKGSEKRFAEMMTAKGKALGLKNTVFQNASGLPDDRHVSSARDLATLCRAVVRDYPEQYRYFATGSFEFRGVRYPNQNRFLRTYYGADGIKTGFINASGHNLAASAVRGGKRLVAIVLGGDTQAWTREHATRLLDVSYAKIDPSMVMVASNASPAGAAPLAPSPLPAPLPVAPPGVPTISAAPPPSPAVLPLPLPNATANLLAFAGTRPGPAAARPPAVAPAPAPGSAQAASARPEPARPASSPGPDAVPSEARLAAAPPAPAADPGPLASTAAQTSIEKPARPAIAAPAPAAPLPSAPAAEEEVERQLLARTGRPGLAPEPSLPRQAPPAAPAPVQAEPAPPAAQPTPQVSGESVEAKPSAGEWSVQVGLFRDATIARRRGEEARSQMPLALRNADLVVARAVDGVHVTSRISRLSEQEAREACSHLQRGRVPCVVVPPGRPLVVATN